MPVFDALLLAGAAFCAGILNTVAGGGTFLTFPALVFTGVPVVAANATSAVAVFPGYLGGAMGFRREIAAFERKRLLRILLATAAGVAALLLATTMASGGAVAMWSVLAIGLFNSVMFPTIFTTAIEGLGPLTGRASSLLVMAIVGGAVVPLAQGFRRPPQGRPGGR